MTATAIAYVRYSSVNQRDESIEAQLRAIYQYANKEGLQIIGEYIDRAESGTSDDRPEFLRMIKDLPDVKPNLVLVHKINRFARNRYDAAIYRREIKLVGARLVAVDQPIDDSPEGVILESLLEGMAEYYSLDLAREVMKGMKENAYDCKFNGGRVPLGFDIDSKGHYVINESEAVIIRKIFDMKRNGCSHGQIVDELNKLGYRTKNNSLFYATAIHEMLKNERYTGAYIYNKTPKSVNGKRNNRVTKPKEEIIKMEGAIPAIVDKDTWDEVQFIMNKSKTGPRKSNNTTYILTGVLKCPECGGPMVGFASSKKNKTGERIKYYYYICNTAKRKMGCEYRKQYPKSFLEQQVVEKLKNEINIKDIQISFDILWEEIQKVNTDFKTEQTHLRLQLAKVEEKLAKYLQAIENGVDASTIASAMNAVGQEKKEIEHRLKQSISPFSRITPEGVRTYLDERQNKEYDFNNLEEAQKIVIENIHSITIKDGKPDITYKAQLGAYNSGVGRGTLYYTHYE